MRLKVLTAGLLFGIVLLLGLVPTVLGPLPKKGASREFARQYSEKSLVVLGLLLLLIVGSAVCAWVILKQEQARYRDESLRNMKLLIEGSLKDLKKEEDAPSERG